MKKTIPLLFFFLLLINIISTNITLADVTLYPDVDLLASGYILNVLSEQTYTYIESDGTTYWLLDDHNVTFADSCTSNHDLIELNGNYNIGNYTALLSCDVYAPSDWTIHQFYMRIYTANNYMDINMSTGFTTTTINTTHQRYTKTYNPSNTLTDADMGNFTVNVYTHASNSTLKYYGYREFTDVFQVYELDPPYNGTSTYYENISYLNLTWTMANQSDLNIIVRKNTSDNPTTPTDGYIVYNGTNTYYNTSINDTRAYSIFSYNTTTNSYSEPLMLEWGTIILRVYNASQPWIQIQPFNLLISSYDGTDTYQNDGNTNPVVLDLLDIPYGDDTAIIITAQQYQQGIYYYDLTPNIFYNLTLYLIPVTSNTTEEGGGGGSDEENTTDSALYYLRVVETIQTEYTEVDRGVEGALVEIKQYMNTTDSYMNISLLITDANGYCNLYLLPGGQLYKVHITADGFDSKTSDYIPAPPNEYGQTELKTFRIVRTTVDTTDVTIETVYTNISYTFEPIGTRHHEIFTFYYNITSSDNKLEWYRMLVYYYNDTTNTWILLSEQNDTTSNGGSLSYTIPNITGRYSFECYYKKEGYDEYEIGETGSLLHFFTLLHDGFETIPDYAWFLITIVIMIVAMGICLRYFSTGIATGYIGIGIFAIMLLFKDITISIGGDNTISGWIILAITFMLYTIGLFIWSRI